MCFSSSTTHLTSAMMQHIRSFVRHKINRRRSSRSSTRSSPQDTEISQPVPKSMISAPMSCYKDPSSAAISMSKLAEDHESFVQSVKSSQRSSAVPSVYGDGEGEKAVGKQKPLSVLEPNVGSFVDGLQLKGARVSTMFKGVPWLQSDEEKDIAKRRSVFKIDRGIED